MIYSLLRYICTRTREPVYLSNDVYGGECVDHTFVEGLKDGDNFVHLCSVDSIQ